jgi:integrase
MAHAEKYGKYWYVRYKDESGKWRWMACGRKANRNDADYLANEYSARELNYHHKVPVRIITLNLPNALEEFRDNELPRSLLGIDKQESSIKREKASVNNIISFVAEKGLLKFISFDKDMAERYMDSRKKLGIMPKMLREERRLLRKFYKWVKKRHYCSDDPTSELIAPKLVKKHPRYFLKEELMKIFELVKEPYRSIFIFLFLTGLRTGELCNLEWRDYNKEQKTLTIRIISADKKRRTPGNKTKREETNRCRMMPLLSSKKGKKPMTVPSLSFLTM